MYNKFKLVPFKLASKTFPCAVHERAAKNKTSDPLQPRIYEDLHETRELQIRGRPKLSRNAT